MAMNPQNAMPGAQDPDKQFIAEAENLEVMEHKYLLDGIEERILASMA
jgi:ER membrane protein complex subunit 3